MSEVSSRGSIGAGWSFRVSCLDLDAWKCGVTGFGVIEGLGLVWGAC